MKKQVLHLLFFTGFFLISAIVAGQDLNTDENSYPDSNAIEKDLTKAGCEVKVPTAFTPNGDGNNDILYPRAIKVTNLQFEIFNRWGQMVYESQQLTDGWDGTFHDIPLNSEVFVYFIRATCPDRTTIERKGTVTLIR